jgi:HlyD family secretion protein
MTIFSVGLASLMAFFGWVPQTVFQGYTEGEYVLIGPADTGRLAALDVVRGDKVATGALLFALDPTPLLAARDQAAATLAMAEAQAANLTTGNRPPDRAAVVAQQSQAKAALLLAQIELQRIQSLQANGAVSRDALDQAQATTTVDAARLAEATASLNVADEPLGRDAERDAASASIEVDRAALLAAQWHLDQAAPTAPAAGLIADTYFRPGEIIAAGQPVISLLPPGNIKVRFYVPEDQLGHFAIGTDVSLACDGCGAPIQGVVRYIAPDAEYTPPVLFNRDNRAKMVFLLEAWPITRQTALHPGQPVDVSLTTP